MVRELKHTEIGDIPVDWELQTFEETFSILSNNTLSRENLNNCGGAVKNIHYGDIITRFSEVLDCKNENIPYLNDISLLTSSAQLLQDGDIIIADTAEDETVGKTTEVQGLGNGKMVAGLHTIPCRVKKGEFTPGWLGYYMNSHMYHNQILPFITGIKVSSISKSVLAKTIIVVPPIDEQKQIIEVLSEIDLLIQKEQKVIDKIIEIKTGCLSKMFPKEGENIPELRLPEFTDVWEQCKLLDIVDLTSSKRIHAQDYVENGIPFYRGKEISELREHKQVSEVLYITEEKFEEMNRLYGSPQLGDILITAVGTIGNTWVVDSVPFYFKDGNLIWFKNIKCNHNYLDYILSSNDGQKKIVASAIGSNQKALTMVKLNELEFMFPSECEQEQITMYFNNLDYFLTFHQRKCEKYMKLKLGLISMLISTRK